MPSVPQLIAGLSEIAPDYDALICDVWGVLHDGRAVFAAAAEALRAFRRTRGPVVLLSNAPRTPADVVTQFAGIGVPPDCYNALVTSGGAARDALAKRAGLASAAKGRLPVYYLGPDRDLSILDGLAVERGGIDKAELVLCVGLVDDLIETPEDYSDTLDAMWARNLTMLCANPDIRVHRGDRLVWCAGALAEAYEKRGGRVVYYGKPYAPIYASALGCAPGAKKPLAIGDGLLTDIKGAGEAGLDALFIADGVHGEQTWPYTAQRLAFLFAEAGVSARAAMRALVW